MVELTYSELKKLLTEALLSAILKDSAGSELSSYVKNLDVLLSTRASEATLSAIKSKTDNIDVLLSTRASESTLVEVRNRLPSSLTATGNLKTAVLEDGVGLAKEATLSAIKNALASVGTDKVRATVVDALPLSPINLTQISGTTLTARDWSSDFAKLQNLNIALNVLYSLIRWGRNLSPTWVIGPEFTAPAAGTTLVSVTVPTGKRGWIYGFMITAGEANDFKINWTSGGTAYSKRIVFGGKGTVHFVDMISLNEGLSADPGTSMTITNVNAGSSGVVYQCALLHGEE